MKPFLASIPPFAVGVAAATTGHFAVGMLLFDDQRMFQSLTVILAVELASLGAGLNAGWPEGLAVLDVLRRRWILLLIAVSVSAAYAIGWTLTRGWGTTPASQGAGLAFMGAMPLYVAGLVLRAMHRLAAEAPVRTAVVGPAVYGAAVGVLAVGTIGIGRIGAPSMILFALMLLSSSALLQNILYDSAPQQWESEAAEEPEGRDEEE